MDFLSISSQFVLEKLANGHSIEQILQMDSQLTYRSIMQAAKEALDIIYQRQTRLEKIRRAYPKAYTDWTSNEIVELKAMFQSSMRTRDISRKLERPRREIKMQLAHLGLLPIEQAITESRPTHIDRAQENFRRAYEPWTAEEEIRLKQMYEEGMTITELSSVFERGRGAIQSRLVKLSLLDQTKPFWWERKKSNSSE